MIPPASTRPLHPVASDGSIGNLGHDLIVNIKSQGRWAAFGAHKTMAKALLLPGMMDYQGPARDWDKAIDSSYMPGDGLVCLLADALVPVPGSYGVVIVDYDARRAVSIQDYGMSFQFVSLNMSDAISRGMAQHLHAGHLPGARLRGSSLVDLPTPPARALARPMEWAASAMSIALGKPASHILNEEYLELPLQIPGWVFLEARTKDPEATAWLAAQAPGLHPEEMEAWRDWATAHELEHLLPIMAAARLEHHLDPARPSPAPRL